MLQLFPIRTVSDSSLRCSSDSDIKYIGLQLKSIAESLEKISNVMQYQELKKEIGEIKSPEDIEKLPKRIWDQYISLIEDEEINLLNDNKER